MTGAKRDKQKEQTRKHIIEIAFQQFAQHGIQATRTLDIANAAGLAHGSVFAHFPTREMLLASVTQEFGNRIAGRIHDLAARGGSLREVLTAHVNGLSEYELFYTRWVAEQSSLPPEARNSLVMIQSAISLHLQQAAASGMDAGKIRRLPLHLFFNTWMGLIHYYLANGELFAPGESVLRRYGPELIEYFLNLMAV